MSILVSILVGFVGAAAHSILVRNSGFTKVIRAERYEVLGQRGKVVASWSHTSGNRVVLQFNNHLGQAVASLGLNPTAPLRSNSQARTEDRASVYNSTVGRIPRSISAIAPLRPGSLLVVYLTTFPAARTACGASRSGLPGQAIRELPFWLNRPGPIPG